MSSTLVELTASIVSSHATSAKMSQDELLSEIQNVYQTLKNLGDGTTADADNNAQEEAAPAVKISPKRSIQKDQIICLICGKGGFKTLTRHLKQVHDMKPAAYRKKFDLPSGTPLAAKSYSESRRQAALDNKLGENLTKARQIRMEKRAAAKAEEVKAVPVTE
ncbi:MAG: MucR family transcriptional regulator [Trichlorobacter sp.]|nr:MucR family transcriptional regulator [Trichlorobacter sp.]